MEPLTLRFDYTSIDSASRDLVQQRTSEIRDRMGRAAMNIMEIGTRLIEVKDALPHGQFGRWLSAEFDWGVTTASKMMNVARAFKSSDCENLNIAPSALYLLSEPDVDPAVRRDIIARAEAGEKVTHADAKAAVDPARKSSEKTVINGDTGELIDNPIVETVTVKPFKKSSADADDDTGIGHVYRGKQSELPPDLEADAREALNELRGLIYSSAPSIPQLRVAFDNAMRSLSSFFSSGSLR